MTAVLKEEEKEGLLTNEFQNQQNHDEKNGYHVSENDDLNFSNQPPKSYQYRALFRKTLKLQMRAKVTLACQLLFPLAILLFMGLMQIRFNTLIRDEFVGDLNPKPDPEEFFYFDDCSRNSSNYWLASIPYDDRSAVGTLKINGSSTGLFSHIIQTLCESTGSPNINLPYAEVHSSRSDLIDAILNANDAYIAQLRSGRRMQTVQYPQSSLSISNVTLNSIPGERLHFDLEVFTLRDSDFPYSLIYDYSPEQIWSGLVQMITNAMLGLLTTKDLVLSVNYARIQGFPFTPVVPGIDLGSWLASLLYPLIMSWLLPAYMYTILLEKEERLREMMKMMGLHMYNYWVVNWVWFFMLYATITTIVFALSYAFNFGIFVNGVLVANLITFLLWGNAQIAMAFFYSAFFNRTRLGTIFGYAVVLITTTISVVVNLQVFQDDPSPVWWNLYPPFAFYRIVSIIGFRCGADFCLSDWSFYRLDQEITQLWFYLFFTPFAYYILAFYLDEVLPKEYGVSKSPLFPIYSLLKLFKSKPKPEKYQYEEESKQQAQEEQEREESIDKLEDEEVEPQDVQAERRRVELHQYDSHTPVVIKNLRKTYTGSVTKTAVHNLNLIISSGECFGLLGPNGAGKTTIISILTSLFSPSRGSATVGGFDVVYETDYVHRTIGVCPQFDTLWNDLTCEETLLFYARLKGIPSNLEDTHVHEALCQVGLDHVKTRLVRHLSGGMRRRLSVAVALTGHPKIIFLDEPTTGLDPESKRALWEVLLNIKQNWMQNSGSNKNKKHFGMILTTHSMEEADVLCDRIGIVARGRLQCVGAQEELKRRFGGGYTIHLIYGKSKEQRERVMEFMKGVVGDQGKIVEEYEGTSVWQVEKGRMKISQFFETMESTGKTEGGVTDWGISQTSLEDVFLTIIKSEGI